LFAIYEILDLTLNIRHFFLSNQTKLSTFAAKIKPRHNMKKLFTLLVSMLILSTSAFAQSDEIDETFVFVDNDGNVVPDGSVITVTTLDDFGTMAIPLSVKNTSGSKAAVALYETIDAMPNGSWQTCAFGNCMVLASTGYSQKMVADGNYDSRIETEWIPVEGQYATWEAQLQIHIFNIVTKTVFGQTTEVAGDEVIGYGPVVKIRFEYKSQEEVSSVGTLIMGAYTTDALASTDNSSGFGRYATGKLSVFNLLESSEIAAYDGGDIVKMRVGLCETTTISRIIIYPITSGNIGNPLLDQTVEGSQVGWNEFVLDTPLTLNVGAYEGLLIGFEYNQTSTAYPLSVLDGSHEFYVYGDLGQGEGFYNAGPGDLSVQCYVQSKNFPKKDIVLTDLALSSKWYKAYESLSYSFNLQNFGTADIANYAIDVELDDTVIATKNYAEVLTPQNTIVLEDKLNLSGNLKMGKHKIGLRLKHADGEAPAGNVDNDYVSADFTVYKESVARQKNLIEQFTSQSCTYCPRGVTLFSDLTGQRDDVVWVSVHGNMSTKDIYNTAVCDTIMSFENVSGFPSASYNRSFVPDLAESPTEIAYGLGYNMSYRTQIVAMLNEVVDYTAQAPSFVTLNIAQTYDENTRQLNITVSGEGAENAAQLLHGYGLNLMLTENDLVARQLNEGKWVNNFTHHYVLRAVLGKCTGNSIVWNGDDFTAQFSYTIPDDYAKDNMYVVAFVAPMIDLQSVNTLDLAVNNCEVVAVKEAQSSAIRMIDNERNNQSMRYALDGRQLNTPEKGLNIVRMTDGSIRKIVVK